jgi:hypothetical protein
VPTAQLHIKLPDYAREMLWLTGKTFQMQVPNTATIDLSKFTGELPLVLRWGTADGSPLQRWQAMTQYMNWQGEVAIGGFVEAVHLLVKGHLELMVMEVRGNTLDPDAIRLPSMADLRNAPFERTLFAEEDAFNWYAFLLPLDSPLSDFAHYALVNGQAVDCYGCFAEQVTGFQEVVGMPLVLESITIYGGGKPITL